MADASDKKKIMLVIPHMIGGGAERVASVLMNEFAGRGYETEIILTSDDAKDVVRCDLKEETKLTLLRESLAPGSLPDKLIYGVLLKIVAQLGCNLFELFRLPVPALLAKSSLYVQYHAEIKRMREILSGEPDTSVIAFLQPAIPIVILASLGLPNRVVFSERGDPKRLMKKRYGRKFVEKYYTRADASVFQSEAARSAYPGNIAKKGVVIFNPLKSGLPGPYTGERDKRVVTFCRISRQKNLPLLVRAFALFSEDHPDYTLSVCGDTSTDDDKAVKEETGALISELGLDGKVGFAPFKADLHRDIAGAAMYVNSSDYEGLSNAMLESMAIGLPCVCTDCPAGGARAVIEDGVNGLLVPVGDAEKMCAAMRRVTDEAGLADRLSASAAAFGKTLSASEIAGKWLELL